jgi:hypothetical protein
MFCNFIFSGEKSGIFFAETFFEQPREEKMARQVVREHLYSSHYSLISWKSILAGLFVTLITYVALSALGAGLGGATASSVIRSGGGADNLATGAAVWIGVSTLLALAAGSYFAARTSTFITSRIGAAQGLIIASIFFSFMIYGVGKTLGFAGKGLGNMASTVTSGAGDLASDPMVQNTVQQALGDANLKSDIKTVVQNLGTFLIRGDRDSARNYLSYETGLPPEEIEARFEKLQQEFSANLKTAGVRTAKAVSNAGWALFITLLIGIGASVGGGALGSVINLRRPLTDEKEFPHITRHAV